MRPTERGAVSRRRFIAIAGAAAGSALLPGSGSAAPELHQWRGVALGAAASIRLLHPDRSEARRIIAEAVQEIERLEAILSLYHAGSAVSELNRAGRLRAPPIELVEVLAHAAEVSRVSGGAFDVTVQPLWQRYREHFALGGTALPAVADLLPLVDWRAVRIEAAEVSFGRDGMAVTLNGIAQGFVTDRIAQLLRRNGVAQVLLDLGEARAVGQGQDGRPWRIGIADPAEPGRALGRLDCIDRAVATSGGYGTVFDRHRRYSHLIDPRSGRTAPVLRGVTVVAGDAMTADAWSTAFALMERDEIAAVARRIDGISVYLAAPEGVAPVA